MLVAQVSDIHAEADADSLVALFRALDYLRPLKPSALLVSGDVSNKPWQDGYVLAHKVLRLAECPVYILPGNSDGREAMRAGWPGFRYWPKFGPMHFAVTIDEMRLVAVDVTVPGESYGEASSADLNWLREQVNTGSPLPVMVMTHQHPFRIGIPALDAHMCLNGNEIEAILDAAKDPVVAAVCGHGHRAVFTHMGKTTAIMCPPLTGALPLLFDGAPEPEVTDAPALLLHHIDGRRLVTHLVSLD